MPNDPNLMGLGAGAGIQGLKYLAGYGNIASGLAGLGGAAMGQIFGQQPHNVGGQIGGAVGGIAGSFLPIPVLGTFAGGELGKAVGGLFGPGKSVGPNGTWGFDFSSGQPMGISGDNNFNPQVFEGPGMAATTALQQIANQYGGSLNGSMQYTYMAREGVPRLNFYGPDGKPVGNSGYTSDPNRGYATTLQEFVPDTIKNAIAAGILQIPEDKLPELYSALGGRETAMERAMQAASAEQQAYWDKWDPNRQTAGNPFGGGTVAGDVNGGNSAGVSGPGAAGTGAGGYAGGGYVDGDGGGMEDSVPTTIEGDEPAALSHGEYVMPADVVAALGDGNNKAGAKKLDGLIALLRHQKYGRSKQPPPVGLPSLLKRAKIV